MRQSYFNEALWCEPFRDGQYPSDKVETAKSYCASEAGKMNNESDLAKVRLEP